MMRINLNQSKPGYDVVVVGAGPAGCLAAYCLGNGFSTLLIDSKRLPREKPCGGVLVSEAKAFLDRFDIPPSIFVYPKELDITYLDLNNNSEKTVSKAFLNVDRKRFDEWLFSLLEPKDVHISDETKLVDFAKTKDRQYMVLVLESNGDIKTIVTRYLIACDGALSIVRQKMMPRKIPYYIAMQQTIEGDNFSNAFFIYDNEVTDFYSWIIPKNKTFVFGSALLPLNPKEKFNLLKQKISKKFAIPNNGKTSSALILRPKSAADVFLGAGNILLAGEAAGLISSSSGEGISFALQSGCYAAEAISNSPKEPFPYYHKISQQLTKRVQQKMKKARLITDTYKRKLF